MGWEVLTAGPSDPWLHFHVCLPHLSDLTGMSLVSRHLCFPLGPCCCFFLFLFFLSDALFPRWLHDSQAHGHGSLCKCHLLKKACPNHHFKWQPAPLKQHSPVFSLASSPYHLSPYNKLYTAINYAFPSIECHKGRALCLFCSFLWLHYFSSSWHTKGAQ